MPIDVSCPSCGAYFHLDPDQLHRQVRCGSCRSVFVPATSRAERAKEEWEETKQEGSQALAIAALVVGIVSLVAWCLPICGLPVSVAGLILAGVVLTKPGGQGLAIAGLFMSGLSLVLTFINAAAGVYLKLNGH